MTRDNGHIVVSQRDLSRETDRYSTQWIVTQKTPEEVQAYLLQKYGKLPEPTKRHGPRVDVLSKERYLEYRAKGLNNAQIGARLGISAQAVQAKSKAWGISIGRGVGGGQKAIDKIDRETYLREHASGKSDRQIAKEYGMNHATLNKRGRAWRQQEVAQNGNE